jgi:hypothetical protein
VERKVKRMTAIVGMFSTDNNLVIGADSEESGETLKRRVDKLRLFYDLRGNTMVIGGAGPACHVDTLAELFTDDFLEKPAWKNDPELKNLFRKRLEDYYKNHVLCWPSVIEREDNDFSMIIGLSSRGRKGQPHVHRLWTTDRNTLTDAFPHAAIGLGRTYAQSLMEDYRGCYSDILASLAVIHILQKIKRDVSNCGRDTQIWRFANDGPCRISGEVIHKAEESFTRLERVRRMQFFNVVDTEARTNEADKEHDLHLQSEQSKMRSEFRKLASEIEEDHKKGIDRT